MEIKTTQQIIEDLGISTNYHNKDKIRDFTVAWVKLNDIYIIKKDIEELIKLSYSTKSLLIKMYEKLCIKKNTGVSETKIRFTSGGKNGKKKNTLEGCTKKL